MNKEFSIARSDFNKIEKAGRFYYKGEIIVTFNIKSNVFTMYLETLDKDISKSYLIVNSSNKKLDKQAHDYCNELFDLDLSNLNDYIDENDYASLSFDEDAKGTKDWVDFKNDFIKFYADKIIPILDDLKI